MTASVPDEVVTPPIPSSGHRRAGMFRFARFVVLKAGTHLLYLVQGLLAVNVLSKQEYGVYALAFAAVSAAAGLANAGFGMFVSSVGGRHAQDRNAFRAIAVGTMAAQRQFTALALVVLAATLPFQLIRSGSAWWAIAGVCLLAPAVLVLQVCNSLNRDLLAIHLMLGRNQLLDMVASTLRIGGFLVFAVIPGAASAVVFLALNLLTILVYNRMQAQYLGDLAAGETRADEVKQRRDQARSMAWQQLPNAGYWSLQGQIPYLLMSLFGTIGTVAEFAALGRLGMLFAFMFEIIADWFAPRIGRCQDPVRLRRMVIAVALGAPLAGAAMLVVVWAARHQLLWLLGDQYAGLAAVFPLALVQVGLGFWAGMLYRICAARAWLGRSWILMVSNLSVQAVGVLFFDLSTVRGVLQFQIAPLAASLLVIAAFLFVGLARDRKTLAFTGGP